MYFNTEGVYKRMNLPIFLKEIDNLTEKLSKDKLKVFIHEIARTLPENARNRFLQTLKASENSLKVNLSASEDNNSKLLKKEVNIMLEKLNVIHTGERCLDSEYNEEYDDWYNSSADEVLFTDPDKVLIDINEAVRLLHRCIDSEVYLEGLKLAKTLIALEVYAEGDYSDYNGSPLGLSELVEYNLLENDFRKLVLDILYVTYVGNELVERSEALYSALINFRCYDIKLEDILQVGNHELPEFSEFLKMWINYLGSKPDRNAERLIKDAQSLLHDDFVMLENARKFVNQHPSLYEELLRMKLDTDENDKMFKIGWEALDSIPKNIVVRSSVALLTAEYAIRLDSKAAMELCWLEAFRSKSSIVNYMRLRLFVSDWSKYEVQVNEIYEQIYQKSMEENRQNRHNVESEKMNGLNQNEYQIIQFFEQQFSEVIQSGMNETQGVGWSQTFMKQGLAFYLLLLFNGEELTVGLKVMLGWAISSSGFSITELLFGTGIKENTDMTFWKFFLKWKSTIHISDIERQEWISFIDKKIELRVKGIMEGNHRKYYNECASYISGLGEVLESMGSMNAKLHIMEKYRKEYSRRSSFHQELRAYGL